MPPKIRFLCARVNYTCYEVKTENRAVFVACMAIVGVGHTPVNEILTKNWRMGWYMRRAAAKKIPPRRDHRAARQPPKRPQIGAAEHYDWYVGIHQKAIKRPYMGIFAPPWLRYTTCHTTLRANTGARKGGSTGLEALGWYYFTQSTILHKVFASLGIRTRPPRAAPAGAGHIEQQHNIS